MSVMSWLFGDSARYRQLHTEYLNVVALFGKYKQQAIVMHEDYGKSVEECIVLKRERDVLNTQLATMHKNILALSQRNLALSKFVPSKYLTAEEILALEANGHVPTSTTEFGPTQDGRHGRRHSRSAPNRKTDVPSG